MMGGGGKVSAYTPPTDHIINNFKWSIKITVELFMWVHFSMFFCLAWLESGMDPGVTVLNWACRG